jgi:hypothetical protein
MSMLNTRKKLEKYTQSFLGNLNGREHVEDYYIKMILK